MNDHKVYNHETIDAAVNLQLELPLGYWAEIKPRSSIAKLGLQTDAGIIDNGYRGPIYIVCRNTTHGAPIVIKAGDRVAQLIFHKLHVVRGIQVPMIQTQATSRGTDGFGSTGT